MTVSSSQFSKIMLFSSGHVTSALECACYLNSACYLMFPYTRLSLHFLFVVKRVCCVDIFYVVLHLFVTAVSPFLTIMNSLCIVYKKQTNPVYFNQPFHYTAVLCLWWRDSN